MNSYDAIAEKWHDFRKNSVINKCIEEFSLLLPEHASVLDAGCGTGFPVDDFLVKKGFFVTGIDPSREMLLKAEKLNLPRARFIRSDFLNFTDIKAYDAIIALDSLWYIPL